MSAEAQNNGFPEGYFVIRSAATGRLLDVSGGDMEDGTEILLWPEKETSLVEGRRNKNAENQVFYIDTSGALCSRSSGHALDIEGSKVVLRHRRPFISPFPNAFSHPLPKFSFSKESGEISVQFSCDPTYPPPSSTPSETWRDRSYVITAIPKRKPKGKIGHAFSSVFGSSSNQSTLDDMAQSGIELGDDEILEEDRGEEGEIDDSPEMIRNVRMLTITDKKKSDKQLLEKARNRRKWQVIQLRTMNARTGH